MQQRTDFWYSAVTEDWEKGVSEMSVLGWKVPQEVI